VFLLWAFKTFIASFAWVPLFNFVIRKEVFSKRVVIGSIFFVVTSEVFRFIVWSFKGSF